MKERTGNVSKAKKQAIKPLKNARKMKVNTNSVDASFTEIHRTKMTKMAAEMRKTATSKLVPVKAKLSVPSREAVMKTGDDLERLLKDF